MMDCPVDYNCTITHLPGPLDTGWIIVIAIIAVAFVLGVWLDSRK